MVRVLRKSDRRPWHGQGDRAWMAQRVWTDQTLAGVGTESINVRCARRANQGRRAGPAPGVDGRDRSQGGERLRVARFHRVHPARNGGGHGHHSGLHRPRPRRLQRPGRRDRDRLRTGGHFALPLRRTGAQADAQGLAAAASAAEVPQPARAMGRPTAAWAPNRFRPDRNAMRQRGPDRRSRTAFWSTAWQADLIAVNPARSRGFGLRNSDRLVRPGT
jgi:hypothetical protein